MSDSLGRFRDKDRAATGIHQKAGGNDKQKHPLPASIEYRVPFELGKRLRAPGMNTVDPHRASTLVQPEVATLVYMDVGRWSGSAPTEKDTPANWGKRRDFGIVHGQLAVLCEYTTEPPRDDSRGPVLGDVGKAIQSSPEFERIRPLLKTLSSNRVLGWVKVTKAVLGRSLNNETPKEDRIYVFLGDLHAPVMTEGRRTYSDEPQQKSLADTGMAVQSIPGAYASAALASGILKRGPLHEWRGRYDPGDLASEVLPTVARGVGESAKAIVQANPIAIYAGEAQAVAEAPTTAATVVTVGGAVSAILMEIAAKTRLREWPDSEGGHAESVRDWFDRYHGTREKKGADIFEDAGADLLLWLTLLKDYQANEGGKLPVRLMQLGDLFDFWIGLKCPFDLIHGSRSFLNKPKAMAFVKYWMDETLRAPAIRCLWDFDKHTHVVTRPDLKTVFLYGNHDTYMGSLLPEIVKERFEDDPGLVAQHGHQEDTFNKEQNAAGGYLLTQAAFSDDHIRGIEDPVSSLGPTLFGGSWTRLDLAEMALRTCIFDRVKSGKKRAMTFVMGHTHEPVLQVIHVVSSPEDKEKATSTLPTSTTVRAPSPAENQSRATSTPLSPPPATPPATSTPGPANQSTKTSTKI